MWPVMTASCAVGLVGAQLGSLWLNPVLGSGVGALAVTVLANTWARIRDRPAATVQVPGILLLVPGSLGFQAVSALMDADVMAGVDAASRMCFGATALVAGTLFGAALVPPRRAL